MQIRKKPCLSASVRARRRRARRPSKTGRERPTWRSGTPIFQGILAKSLLLSDDQKRKLKDYEDAQAKAIADAKSRLCANPPDLSSFEASLNFRQKMIEDQLETVKAINPKLIRFLQRPQSGTEKQVRPDARTFGLSKEALGPSTVDPRFLAFLRTGCSRAAAAPGGASAIRRIP